MSIIEKTSNRIGSNRPPIEVFCAFHEKATDEPFAIPDRPFFVRPPFRFLIVPAAAFFGASLVGCGGAGGVSPATNFNDCVSIGGTAYTVDGPVGEDDGSYPCSSFRSKGITPVSLSTVSR